MIRSLLSITILLSSFLWIGRAIQKSSAEESDEAVVESSEQPQPSEKESAPAQAANKKQKISPLAIQLIPAVDPVDLRTAKEDMSGTDETQPRGKSETATKEKPAQPQASPNPADVPESAETSDDEDDKTSPAKPLTAAEAKPEDSEKNSSDKNKNEKTPSEKSTNTPNSEKPKADSTSQPKPEPAKSDAPSDTAVPPAEQTNDTKGPRHTPLRETPVQDAKPNADSTLPKDTDSKPTDAPPKSTITKVERPLPLPVELLDTRNRVRQCLRTYFNEPINTAEYSPWGIMHALIAFGVDTEVYAGNRKVNAIGWLCYNGPCRGMQMMYVKDGKLRLRIGPGYQGHEGQFLAMLAQSRVKTDFPLRVDGHEFTVADLIETEKQTCRPKTELTFKLIGLSHYLETSASWKSESGESWDIPRLIREELAQPIVGAACGGTHRMTGFSYAVNKRTRLEESFDGQWLRAKQFVAAYHDYIFRLQNYDGSFSTKWFAAREDFGDIDRRVQTTGHMLEWLVRSLPKEQLDDPRVIRSVNYLTELLMEGLHNRKKWEIGPRGHAIHALALYAERRYGDKAGLRDEMLSKRPTSRVANSQKTDVR